MQIGTGQIGNGSLSDLARLRTFRRERLSSWDQSGGNLDALQIKAGGTATLGTIEGAGCVKHIWVTMMTMPEDPADLCKVVLRARWDGCEQPSIHVPVGDFFGLGFGKRRNFSSLPLQASPENGKSLNCWFPMPFANGAHFEIENQSDSLLIFFFYIDYESYASLEPGLGRFHACWNRQNPTAGIAKDKGWTRNDFGYSDERPVGAGFGFPGPWREANLDAKDNYVILDASGDGQYVGCVLNIDVFERQVNDWYGEGDDMIFVDGEPWPPRLHGTGTEDYFNTAFCPTQEFSAPYHGITLYSGNPSWPWGGKNSMYRFHVEDPIRFEKSIKVTIETGHANALANDYSSVAYWYQSECANPGPQLAEVDSRLPRPDNPELTRPRG